MATNSDFNPEASIAEIRLAGSKTTVSESDLSQSGVNVSAGNSLTVTIAPPVGEMWEVYSIGLEVAAPPNATTGTHNLELIMNKLSDYRSLFTFSNTYSASLRFRRGYPDSASSYTPNNMAVIQSTMQHIKISNALPLLVVYTNLTDVSQTNNIAIVLEKVVRYVV